MRRRSIALLVAALIAWALVFALTAAPGDSGVPERLGTSVDR